MKRKGKITEKELKYFIINDEKATNLGKMYLLPKIHKRLYDVPGRPVISSCGTPTEKVSKFLGNQLKPIMQEGMSYIKDSNDFKHTIRDLKDIPNNALLVTADVVGLYPSIPCEAGFQALKEVLEQRKDQKISTNDLVKMAAFVLKKNYFEFNGEVKHQISRTAIGTKFAPTHASIFMDEIETKFLDTQEFKSLVWFQYIDDVFFIWTHGKEKLEEFLKYCNNYHPIIKFTHEFNKENILILDLRLSLSGGQLTTDLHIKSTDKHQYLHYTSACPDHTKRSIVFSQALRAMRVCYNKTDFERHLDDMESWFQARGYPKCLVQKEMIRVRFNKEGSNNKQSKYKRVTFVVTYRPLLKSFQSLINKYLSILHLDENAKEVFMPGPLVTFLSSRTQ